jgi:predicted transposase YdaD
MPIHYDFLKRSKVVGPLLRRGRAEGLAEGRVEGRAELMLLQLEKRFGALPPETRERLAGLTPRQLRNSGLRILDAKRIADVFPR